MRILLVLILLTGCGADDPPVAPAAATQGAGTISTGSAAP